MVCLVTMFENVSGHWVKSCVKAMKLTGPQNISSPLLSPTRIVSAPVFRNIFDSCRKNGPCGPYKNKNRRILLLLPILANETLGTNTECDIFIIRQNHGEFYKKGETANVYRHRDGYGPNCRAGTARGSKGTD